MLSEILISFVVGLLIVIYVDFKKNFNYWKSRNVPFLEPSVPLGNIADVIKSKQHFGVIMQDMYNKTKQLGDYCGIYFFRNPVLLVLSPDFAKTVLVRDFNSFCDRGVYSNEEIDPLSANLFFLEGQRWKDLRAKLTPTFTSGKLKQMSHTVLDVGHKLIEHMQSIAEQSSDVEVYDLLARFNTDVISSCAFGLESDSLANPDTEFRTMGRKMLNFGRMKSLKIFFAMAYKRLSNALGVRFNDEDVADFFLNLVKETIKYRSETGYERKDFMQLLINLMKKDENDDDKLTFYEIAAQAYVFYFAGEIEVSNK